MTDDWFSVVEGDDLEQGDLLPQCSIYRVETLSPDPDDQEVMEQVHDVVVLTQTCDLIHDKVQEVLVASVISYSVLVDRESAHNPSIKGRDFRKALVENVPPSYLLLPEQLGAPSLPWSIVDFHHLFSLPKQRATDVADGLGPRLRLRSPYKEHLSQSFASYMMRVALPETLHTFIASPGGSTES